MSGTLNRALMALVLTPGLSVAGAAYAAEDTLAQDSQPAETAAPAVVLDTFVVQGELTRFSATKSDVPVVETARSVSVETSEQFYEKGATNLSQATSYMAGVTAETYGFSTRGDWMHARGLQLPRYRDSIQEVFGNYNNTRPELYTIEQVEVLRGPASVLYGEGSPSGIINYVSKTPKAETRHEVVAEYGSYDRKQLGFDSTGQLGSEKWLYRLVAMKRDADTQVEHVEDDSLVLMPSISYVPSDATRFTLIAQYQDTDSDTGAQFIPVEGTLNPLAGGGYIDQDVYAGEPGWNQYDTDSRQLTALAEHAFNDQLSLEATALWREGEADYDQAWPMFTGAGNSRYLNQILGAELFTDTTVPRSFYQADSEFELYAFDVRLSGDFTTGALRHETLLGVQTQQVSTQTNSAYYFGGGALSGDFSYVLDLANPVYTGAPDQAVFDAIYSEGPQQKVNTTGVYLSDQISIDQWRITAGLRYDQVTNDTGSDKQDDNQLSTSLGVLYAFDNGLSPYLSYSESFQTVVGTDLNGDQLEPQEARQYEGGVKFEPASFPALFSIAYFDIEISNLDNPNSLPADAAQQQGVATMTGVELEAKAYLGDFYLQGAVSTLKTEDENGFEYAGEPDSNASLWVTWRPTSTRFRAGGGVRYVGSSVSETATVRYETPDYTLIDAMLGYEVNSQLDLSLNVRNLSDEEYLTSCLARGDCFPGVRRSVNAKARYQF